MERHPHKFKPVPLLKPCSGFTIVEIIISIVIVSIISVVIMSRLLGGNTFNPIIVRDQIVSMSRIAQQSALGRADVSFTITPTVSDTVILDVSEIGGSIASVELDAGDVTFSGDINKLVGNQTPSCSADNGDDAITAATPMTINFDELGDLAVSGVTGSTGAITSAVRICLNNIDVDSVCISPAGYAYPGVCDFEP